MPACSVEEMHPHRIRRRDLTGEVCFTLDIVAIQRKAFRRDYGDSLLKAPIAGRRGASAPLRSPPVIMPLAPVETGLHPGSST